MRQSVIMRAATHDRELRRVQWAAAIAPLVLGAILACAVLGAGCYAHTGPTPTCSADPTQPGCLPPLHDRKR